MKVDQSRRWKMFAVAGAALALVVGLSSTVPNAYAGGTIKAGDDQWISLGMGIRSSYTAREDGSANGQNYSNNFDIDNARIYINGKIHKNVGFEFNTECFNCNTDGVALQTSQSARTNATVGLLDAIGKFEFTPYVNLWVGRLLVPGERGELNGPYYHAVFDGFKTPFNQADTNGTFGTGGAGVYGRDNGAVFWGQVEPGRGYLQYSLGLFQGLKGGANQQSSMMYAGRLTYNFFNPEKNPGYYTSGTYYGTAGDILALAVGYNYQSNGAGSQNFSSDFSAFIADLLFEKPLGSSGDKGVITVNAEFKQYFANYNSGAFAANTLGPTLTSGGCLCMFDGNSYTGYALYLFPNEVGIGRFQPYARFTSISPNNSATRQETEAGTNYVISGHNARISAFWQYGDLASLGGNYAPDATGSFSNAFKLAFQLQY